MTELLAGLGIRSISVEEIDYQAFSSTEEALISPPGEHPAAPPTLPLWEGFITGHLLARLDPDGAILTGFEELDTGALAALLNDEFNPIPADYGASIVAFLRRLESGRCDDKTRSLALEKLADLIGRLKPELRSQFLSSTFGALSGGGPVATEFLQKLPPEPLVDTLSDIHARCLTEPPTIFDIPQALSRHGGEPGGKVAGRAPSTGEDTAIRLDLIFREVEADQFVPADYQSLRGKVLAAGQPVNDDGLKLEGLKATLGNHRVENQVSAVILEILKKTPPKPKTNH